MSVRWRIVGRHEDGRKLITLWGDELPWRYDAREEIFWVNSSDGKIKYVVARSRPQGLDRGRPPYRYWVAKAYEADQVINLGDEYMIADEGKEICQVFESARNSESKLPNAAVRLIEARLKRIK